ncbi:MAG: peptidase S41 [Deltaproteobacteria bacterium]|nr:MAG: peptidase S41 [Deltaproteobacteria bacterium]
MRRFAYVFIVVLYVFLLASRGSLAVEGNGKEEDEVYEALSSFTRVLDLVERNYVDEVDTKKLVISAIEGMLKTLDPYSAYLTPERYKELEIGTSGEFGGVGIEVTVKNGVLTVISPIEDTPADKAGIKPGDQIIAINGKSTQGINISEAVNMLRGPKGSSVRITIRREGDAEPREVELVRDIIHVRSVKYSLLDGGIGYIKISQFQERTSKELEDAIERLELLNGGKLKGVILDLRNNPGGLLTQAVEVADEFMDKGLIVSVRGRTEDQITDYYATKEGKLTKCPLVVIVNKGSASASEVVAEALQDSKRAVILGTKTFGKGSVQTIIKLEDGSGLKLTTARFYAPSGRSINEVGVTPDIVVENRDNRDIQLERAKELLRSSKVSGVFPGINN